MPSRETAIVFGVGPGLGWALARRFAAANMEVAAVARDKAKLNSLIQSEGSHDIRPYATSRHACRHYRYPALFFECNTNGTTAKLPRIFASTAWICDAVAALEDPSRVEEIDTRLVYDEEGSQVIGMAHGKVLLVIMTLPGVDTCRIISARKATRHEQDRYYAGNRETW